jgi:hypothetical protein
MLEGITSWSKKSTCNGLKQGAAAWLKNGKEGRTGDISAQSREASSLWNICWLSL